VVTGPYGRQWISPRASYAFTRELLEADYHCFRGEVARSLSLYKKAANNNNYIASRRLAIAKRQLRLKMQYPGICKGDILRLGFIDWYPGFENDKERVLDLFCSAGLNIAECSAEEADILLAGCYGSRLYNEKSLSNDKVVIFFTGENICPSYDIHDFSITTRFRSYCGKNVRHPQWMSELLLERGAIIFRDSDKWLNRDYQKRDLSITAIYNNSTPEREEIVYHLSQHFGIKNVRVFGSQRTGEVNKLDLLARTKINICFENSLGEGYITEKLLHALLMGCKALYWGDSSYVQDFHNADILNIRESRSIGEVIEWCEDKLNEESREIKQIQIVSRGLFKQIPSYAEIHEKIVEWSRLVLCWRRL